MHLANRANPKYSYGWLAEKFNQRSKPDRKLTAKLAERICKRQESRVERELRDLLTTVLMPETLLPPIQAALQKLTK